MGHQSIINNQLPNCLIKSLLIINYWLLVIFWLFYLAPCIFAQTTFDPLTVGVGARALGMGKAYAAVAEEGDTIFTNPAGLGEIDHFHFTSMSATLMHEVNYTMLGGVLPAGDKQAFGLGYVSASLGGIEIRDNAGNLLDTTGFENYVVFASYGRKFNEKLSLGISLKSYSQHSPGSAAARGSGVNMDIALLQRDLGWLSLGAVAQNILDSKIEYGSGEKETLPRRFKIGSKMHLLGDEFTAAFYSDLKLVLVFDADIGLGTPEPAAARLGAEISPTETLTLRAGSDRGFSTLGLSIKFFGIGFHYAYHPFTAENSETHFFSLTFYERGWPPEGYFLNLAKI